MTMELQKLSSASETLDKLFFLTRKTAEYNFFWAALKTKICLDVMMLP
jgi:hypothetical protein